MKNIKKEYILKTKKKKKLNFFRGKNHTLCFAMSPYVCLFAPISSVISTTIYLYWSNVSLSPYFRIQEGLAQN